MRGFLQKLLPGHDRPADERQEPHHGSAPTEPTEPSESPGAAGGTAGESPRDRPPGDRSPGHHPQSESSVHRLDEVERDALEALREGIMALAEFLPEPPDVLRGLGEHALDLTPADLRAAGRAEALGVVPDLRRLARTLVESATAEGSRAPRVKLDAAVDHLRKAVEGLPSVERPGRRRRKKLRSAAARDLESLLREIAAEHLGLVLTLSDPEARLIEDIAFAWHPGRPEELDTCLLERAFQRLEAAVTDTEMLFLQRRISRWWFRRFAPEGGSAAEEFGLDVREAEWALLDRPVPGIDGPVVEAFVRQGLAARLPPRQASLLDRLQGSFVSGFEVLEHEGPRAVFRDLTRRARYEVREHNDDIGYTRGEVALGRLIPGDGDAWQRSPGMAFLGAEPGDLASVIGEALRIADRDGASRSIAVEGIMLALLDDEELPSRSARPSPASSPGTSCAGPSTSWRRPASPSRRPSPMSPNTSSEPRASVPGPTSSAALTSPSTRSPPSGSRPSTSR